jgi:hypothetical protein
MENHNQSAFGPGHYLYGEAQALSLTIAAIRKAMVKQTLPTS